MMKIIIWLEGWAFVIRPETDVIMVTDFRGSVAGARDRVAVVLFYYSHIHRLAARRSLRK
jgi:hypothetical protein